MIIFKLTENVQFKTDSFRKIDCYINGISFKFKFPISPAYPNVNCKPRIYVKNKLTQKNLSLKIQLAIN